MKLATCLALVLVTSRMTFLCADEPVQLVQRWSFESDLDGVKHGQVSQGMGATPAVYPTIRNLKNRALKLSGDGYVSVTDDGRFRFVNGEAITIEAWVRPDKVSGYRYIIGKGRTGARGAKSINQNWALRLAETNGKTTINFLFRSKATKGKPGDWHRWNSRKGIVKASRWHHVAVSYRYGDPKSIKGFIDGEEVNGAWDMGGPTTQEPIADLDDVWIGSAIGGNPQSSFDGFLDEVAIYRGRVKPEVLKSRYQWIAPKTEPPKIPANRVVVQLFGPINSVSRIPTSFEAPLYSWDQDELAFSKLPQRYDEWGIRADWGTTLVCRAWSRVVLPKGKHQILVRSRGMSRLYMDGKQVAQTAAQKSRGNAHNVVDDLPKVPVEGMRPHWMNDRETIVEVEGQGRAHEFRFDVVVGGPRHRVEFGETCVAIARPGEMFYLLGSLARIPLTDEGWRSLVAKQRQRVTELDRKNRALANALKADYWGKRHRQARDQIVSNEQGSIDGMIASAIERHNKSLQRGKGSSQDTVFFKEKVAPILNARCARCHRDKEQGGLSIKTRQGLLEGGDSGPAIVPGKPDESYLIQLVSAKGDELRMPPKGDGLTEAEVATLTKWVREGAAMPMGAARKVIQSSLTSDLGFLRRLFIDTVGVPPTLDEIELFRDHDSATRREFMIDRVLKDPRIADNFVGYWQDVFAENPNLLKPNLNNTGPFRWWIHEALADNKPADRFATELILMRGSAWYGGTAGFALASQNDVPMAAKAHVVSSAFLGINLKCARCHDAPYHQWRQSDLFHVAAMLSRKQLTLPSTSTVPTAFFEKQERESLIEASLKAGDKLPSKWPFTDIVGVNGAAPTKKGDARETVAIKVTASRRFAEVMANRLWKRLMGAGLVEPVDDWEGNPPSHPRLLARLADELIRSDYDMRKLAKFILLSDAYQREAVNRPLNDVRFFEGPYRKRMTAEQIVDSAFHVAGQKMRTEPLTLDIEGDRNAAQFQHFGQPSKAWHFTTLANERDRPSLALPRAQAITDVLKAFGWRNSRPEPITDRDISANLVQAGVLSNGIVGAWLTRLTDESEVTALACEQQTVDQFVEKLFLRFLTRQPTAEERRRYSDVLQTGFAERLIPVDSLPPKPVPKRYRYVSWSNHLNTDANKIKKEMEQDARDGDPPTRYLDSNWRERVEDVIWALLNSPEMIVVP